MKRVFLIKDAVFYTVIGAILLGTTFYIFLSLDTLPSHIPAFVSLSGTVISEIPTNVLTVMRLPLMALTTLVLIICMHMISLKNASAPQAFRLFWKGLATFLVLKMTMTITSLFFYTEDGFSSVGIVLHHTSTALAFIGAMVMGYAIWQIHKKENLLIFKRGLRPSFLQGVLIASLVLFYLGLLMMPNLV